MAQDLIVLLHGILRSKIDMLPLSQYLQKQNFSTANILYPSRKKSLEDLTDFVQEKITTHPDYTPDKTVHFVTHSMGGLIARYLIARYRPAHLGKVVMLSPPNTGSEIADYLRDHKVFKAPYHRAFGPAGQQLATDYEHALPAIDYPLGVIAGNRSINPLAFLALKGAHDGIVPVARTAIEGMSDHIIMPVTHSLMMFKPSVMRQTHHFLLHGKFDRLE